ncbi:MAG: hypothetical protein ACI9UN_002384 [Granulosicoccus sp.]|jgi:uncharacterized protein (DUF1330 family)
MSAFMLATIKVKDPVKLQDYLGKVQKLSNNYGAQLLTKGKAVRVITEGQTDHDITIVVKFPDTESIDSLFESEEYQELIPLRENGASMVITSHQILD